MRDVQVRRARREDAGAIASIYNAGIRDRIATFETRERTAAEIETWLADERHPVLVAEWDAHVVGWIAASTYRPRECYAGIAEFSVYVDPAARERGVGDALMRAFLPALEEAGFWKVLSRIFPENEASRALCRRHGFREAGVYVRHAKLDGEWRDVVIVERLLGEAAVTPQDEELAYVFWHWKRPDVPVAEYEARQRAFHEALAAHPPAGFVRSFRSGVTGLPWANGGGAAYEDWYLVSDSAALDALDAGATTGARKTAHDGAASGSAGGTAGVYRVRLGRPLETPRHATWLSRPAGTSYDEWFALLARSVAASGGVLWMRRMVLGPVEFCLQSPVPVELPVQGLTVALRPGGSALS